ncbi:hypothetical protein PG985_008532 [Apiospora marii]|uniref:uncharacterized protein n=1 Tax=Apiospora marii TaxID=335849 RepID=UPI00312DE20A
MAPLTMTRGSWNQVRRHQTGRPCGGNLLPLVSCCIFDDTEPDDTPTSTFWFSENTAVKRIEDPDLRKDKKEKAAEFNIDGTSYRGHSANRPATVLRVAPTTRLVLTRSESMGNSNARKHAGELVQSLNSFGYGTCLASCFVDETVERLVLAHLCLWFGTVETLPDVTDGILLKLFSSQTPLMVGLAKTVELYEAASDVEDALETRRLIPSLAYACIAEKSKANQNYSKARKNTDIHLEEIKRLRAQNNKSFDVVAS